MELTPREKDKLLIFTAALLAERRKARGLKLNYPEAVALSTAAIMEGARDGKTVTSFASQVEPGSTAITARLALQGLGIARLATVVAEPLVRQGLLAQVLADCVDLQPSPIHAITLARKHRLPKIQACIDHWAQWFAAAEPSA